MCLAVPGRVLCRYEQEGSPMARVDFRGQHREVCLEYVPEVQAGEWVLVHLGLAIQRLDEQTARESLALLEEAGVLDDGPVPSS